MPLLLGAGVATEGELWHMPIGIEGKAAKIDWIPPLKKKKDKADLGLYIKRVVIEIRL